MIRGEGTTTLLQVTDEAPEWVSVSRPRRRPKAGTLASVGAGLVLLTACGSSGGSQGTDSRSSAPGEHPAASPSAPPSNAPTTANQLPEKMWPGTSPQEMPYPGRVALPDSTCRVWGIENPQPTFVRDGKLFAIIDARRSIPPNCDYRRDSGAGAYKGASYKAEVQQQPEGDGFVPDGTVVQVTAYSIGQRACNDAGTSPLWIGYKRDLQDETNWSPVINLGGSPTEQTLEQNHVPQQPTEYADTVHANC